MSMALQSRDMDASSGDPIVPTVLVGATFSPCVDAADPSRSEDPAPRAPLFLPATWEAPADRYCRLRHVALEACGLVEIPEAALIELSSLVILVSSERRVA